MSYVHFILLTIICNFCLDDHTKKLNITQQRTHILKLKPHTLQSQQHVSLQTPSRASLAI